MSECTQSCCSHCCSSSFDYVLAFFWMHFSGGEEEERRQKAEEEGEKWRPAHPSMRRGLRLSSSSESEGSQRARAEDSIHQPSEGGRSSDEEDSSSDSDVEVRHGMKRSQRFCSSFSFGEDDRSRNEDGVEPQGSAGAPATGPRTQERLFHRKPPPRSCLFRPQELWLAVTRCLTLRWPPCLTVSTGGKLAPPVGTDQSEDRDPLSDSSTNESSSWTSSSDVKQDDEEVKSRSLPARGRGVSCTTSRLPRVRQAPDPTLAAIILEKETFLRIELVDSGEGREDARYWAEWKLLDRAKELAEGVWLPKIPKPMD